MDELESTLGESHSTTGVRLPLARRMRRRTPRGGAHAAKVCKRAPRRAASKLSHNWKPLSGSALMTRALNPRRVIITSHRARYTRALHHPAAAAISLKQILILYRPLPPIKCARFLYMAPLTSLLPLLLNPLQSFRRPLTQIYWNTSPRFTRARRQEGKGSRRSVVHCNTVYNNAISIERPDAAHELGQNDVHRINQMAPPHAL